MRRKLRIKKIDVTKSIDIPENGFRVIVVDPPWHIQKIKRKVRPNQKRVDYPMLSLNSIKKINISDISADKSICFLWTIDKYLFDSREVLEGWGFNYHCTMAWNKTNGISIYGFNRRVEFVIVGLKGKHEPCPKRKTIHTAFTAKSERHSAKPDEFYKLLDVLPDPKIDVFARKSRKGWQIWGNEVQEEKS
jgi:N6-adenosine-specific RNA methylase IME4